MSNEHSNSGRTIEQDWQSSVVSRTDFNALGNKKMLAALVIMMLTIFALTFFLGTSLFLLKNALDTNKQLMLANGIELNDGSPFALNPKETSDTKVGGSEQLSMADDVINPNNVPATDGQTTPMGKASMTKTKTVSNEVNNIDKAMAASKHELGKGQFAKALDQTKKETALEHAINHQNPNYVCPMHPQILNENSDAKCPICGMDLVILEKGAVTDTVSISPRMINMLGVRTAKVKKRNLYRRIDSVGYIKFDEDKIRSVSLRTDGWIERLNVKSVGDRVKKGQVLFEVYSPKLVNAQEEYLHALSIQGGALLAASRDRLHALGVSAITIRELEKNRQVKQLVKIYAPQNGVITELNIREGNYVPPSKPIISMADLSSVWLVANIFESQAGWIKEGLRARAKLPFLEDKTWEGKVEYVYPSLDLKTRSLEVRIRFKNPGIQLKPNMYANVTIYASPKRKVLVVPNEAIIDTGNSQRVIRALGEGKFKPERVTVGTESNGHVEITHGLEEGDEVVVSSQFLIDSESSMQASIARMQAE